MDNQDIRQLLAKAEMVKDGIRDDITDHEKALAPYHVQTFSIPASGGLLVTDSNVYQLNVDFIPDFWVVVTQLTAGFVAVNAGSGASGVIFRLINKTLRFPVRNDAFFIKTVGASGLVDAYAVKDLSGFDIY